MTSALPTNVLIVDDSLADARLTQLWLRRSSLVGVVFSVRSGAEALQFLRREPPFSAVPPIQLLVVDVQLPDRLGWDLIREIRGDSSTGPYSVIVLTGTISPADGPQLSALGIARYLAKPFDAEEFQALVGEVEQVIRSA